MRVASWKGYDLMMGTKERCFAPLVNVSLEDLVYGLPTLSHRSPRHIVTQQANGLLIDGLGKTSSWKNSSLSVNQEGGYDNDPEFKGHFHL